MKDDLISRQAAINALENTECELLPVEWDELTDAIKAVPSAQPQWIPCSERLPEKDGRYLVTCTKWGAWAVDWNIWHNDPKPSWLWEQSVIAWMPLPEPYEAEREDKE